MNNHQGSVLKKPKTEMNLFAISLGPRHYADIALNEKMPADIRRNAVKELIRMKEGSPLKELVADKNRELRLAAIKGLKALGETGFLLDFAKAVKAWITSLREAIVEKRMADSIAFIEQVENQMQENFLSMKPSEFQKMNEKLWNALPYPNKAEGLVASEKLLKEILQDLETVVGK